MSAYLKAMGADDVVIRRLRSKSLEGILFGSTGFPSDGIDLDFDIECGNGEPRL